MINKALTVATLCIFALSVLPIFSTNAFSLTPVNGAATVKGGWDCFIGTQGHISCLAPKHVKLPYGKVTYKWYTTSPFLNAFSLYICQSTRYDPCDTSMEMVYQIPCHAATTGHMYSFMYSYYDFPGVNKWVATVQFWRSPSGNPCGGNAQPGLITLNSTVIWT